ncbi:hypothetical protein H1R20_g723, partial [Candolleomyces eurysporus]
MLDDGFEDAPPKDPERRSLNASFEDEAAALGLVDTDERLDPGLDAPLPIESDGVMGLELVDEKF